MQGSHNHSLDGTGPGIKLPYFTFTPMTNIKYMEQDVKKTRDLALVRGAKIVLIKIILLYH